MRAAGGRTAETITEADAFGTEAAELVKAACKKVLLDANPCKVAIIGAVFELTPA